MKMKKPKMIFGDDNGECTLWDITLGEYNHYRERIDKAYDIGKDDKAEQLEEELESHKIEHDFYEHGYVPDYMVYIAKVYGIDVESN